MRISRSHKPTRHISIKLLKAIRLLHILCTLKVFQTRLHTYLNTFELKIINFPIGETTCSRRTRSYRRQTDYSPPDYSTRPNPWYIFVTKLLTTNHTINSAVQEAMSWEFNPEVLKTVNPLVFLRCWLFEVIKHVENTLLTSENILILFRKLYNRR